MIVITVAHHLEARYLIDALDLKQNRSFSARQVFENDRLRLVVSGIGSINAAIATTLAFSNLEKTSSCAALNFGICGATPAITAGTLTQAHSIHTTSRQRSFYPDMILNLNLPGASLETREIPYVSGESEALTTDLIDMEAAGFFESARSFVSPDRIFVLKVVSDHGQSFEQIRSLLPALIEAQTPKLREIFSSIQDWLKESELLSIAQGEVLERLSTQLRLTESQYQKLLFLCRALGKESDLLNRLEPFLNHAYTHRQQRSQIFTEIVDALTVSLI